MSNSTITFWFYKYIFVFKWTLWLFSVQYNVSSKRVVIKSTPLVTRLQNTIRQLTFPRGIIYAESFAQVGRKWLKFFRSFENGLEKKRRKIEKEKYRNRVRVRTTRKRGRVRGTITMLISPFPRWPPFHCGHNFRFPGVSLSVSIDGNRYGDNIWHLEQWDGLWVGIRFMPWGGGDCDIAGIFLYAVPGPPFTSGSRKFDSNQTIIMDFNRNFVHNGWRCAWKSERPDTGTRRHRTVHCFRFFVDTTWRRRTSINCVRWLFIVKFRLDAVVGPRRD